MLYEVHCELQSSTASFHGVIRPVVDPNNLGSRLFVQDSERSRGLRPFPVSTRERSKGKDTVY